MIQIIAEIGVNHDGSVEKAKELVRTAKACGADYAKFQTFRAAQLASRAAPTAAYQQRHDPDDQLGMLRRLELPPEAFRELYAYCESVGIHFLSSPFDLESLDVLLELGLTTVKVGSGELTNAPLLERLGTSGVRVILSTGMAQLGEVEIAVTTLQGAGCRDLALLHCVTEYPAPIDQVNLRAMMTLQHAFGLPVGYSDHTSGIDITIAAAALGATIIEKHLTLDRNAPGPDHAASSDAPEFAAMVRSIRNVEACLGDGIKRPAACELPNMAVARKSLVATRDLPAGTVVREGDLTAKRPGNGIAPLFLAQVVGLRLTRNVAYDSVLTWDDFKNA